MNEQIKNLIGLAERVVALPVDTSTENFLELVGTYLDAIDQWQKTLSAKDSPQPAASNKDLLEKLQGLHETILKRAGVNRNQVGAELNSLHQRTQALHKYSNPFTARISITGKRKG